MNFDKSGWLSRYLEFRTGTPFADELPSSGVKVLEEAGLHHALDESVYYFLQPTGLLYGFPIGLPFPELRYPRAEFQTPLDRVHLIFLDSLFACLVADRHFLLQGLETEADHLTPAIASAATFFLPRGEGSAPILQTLGRWLTLRRANGAHDQLERAMSRAIASGVELFRMPGHYYNSFLFLDLYYCMVWQRHLLVEPESAAERHAELHRQQQEQRELLIRMMIAAASSSGDIERAEHRLVSWFIRSSGLPRGHVAELREALEQRRGLDDGELPEMPWLVRRFMLEAALMTTLVDRRLEPKEEAFMEELVQRLQLWKEELNQSLTALEVFILHQEHQLQIFQERSSLLHLSDNIRARASLLIRKNLNRIVQEIRETQELYTLLMKATHSPLSADEKAKVRAQLLDILKTIPALAIFALPGGSLVLPILIRLLPFNLLPSAFEED